MIKSIIFDFFGTIALYGDMKKADEIAYDNLFKAHKLKNDLLNREKFNQEWQTIFSSCIPLSEVTEGTIFLNKISRLAQRCEVNFSPAEIDELGEAYVVTWQSFISFPDNLVAIFDKLHQQYSIGLISNFDHPPHIRNLLKKCNIERFFDSVVISGEVGVNKPSPEIFYIALKELNVSPGEVIYIGDNLVEDVNAATKIGCHSFLIDINNRYPDYRGPKINKLAECLLIDLCNKISKTS